MMSLWARLIDKDKQYVYSNDYKGDVVDGRFSELLGVGSNSGRTERSHTVSQT